MNGLVPLMPSSVPVVPGAQVVRALERAGFALVRIKGSAHIMRHPDGRGVSVHIHSSRDLPKGTLRTILADIGITPDEFRELL